MRPLPELSDEIPEAVKPKAELAAAYLTEVIKAMGSQGLHHHPEDAGRYPGAAH